MGLPRGVGPLFSGRFVASACLFLRDSAVIGLLLLLAFGRAPPAIDTTPWSA